MVAVSSMMLLQLMSVSSWRTQVTVLLAGFSDVEGMQPKAEPRPVVTQISLAPGATRPLAEIGSKPGDTVHPSIRDGGRIIYVGKIFGTKGLEMRSRASLLKPIA